MKCQEKDKVKVYEGESGRSARIRGAEHVRDLEKKRENSALYKHVKNDHSGEEVKFKKVQRCINEASQRGGPNLLPTRPRIT